MKVDVSVFMRERRAKAVFVSIVCRKDLGDFHAGLFARPELGHTLDIGAVTGEVREKVQILRLSLDDLCEVIS